MKSTPTSACEIECDIRPLSIRRDSAIITTCGRYARADNHRNQRLIQTRRRKAMINRTSYMSRASSLIQSYNLPNNREKITTVAPQPIHTTTYKPSLHPHLVVKDATKHTSYRSCELWQPRPSARTPIQ